MTLDNNNPNNHNRNHFKIGVLFWGIVAFFIIMGFCSCRAKKTTVETSKIETVEIVKDSVSNIEKSEIKIEKTAPVNTGSFYPYDTTRTDNPIFENEIDNGSTKVKISSTRKGLSVTTVSKPVENKETRNDKVITQKHTKDNKNLVEKSWYQKIIAVPIYFQWWFWLLILIICVIIRFFVKKYMFPKKIIDTITGNEN